MINKFFSQNSSSSIHLFLWKVRLHSALSFCTILVVHFACTWERESVCVQLLLLLMFRFVFSDCISHLVHQNLYTMTRLFIIVYHFSRKTFFRSHSLRCITYGFCTILNKLSGFSCVSSQFWCNSIRRKTNIILLTKFFKSSINWSYTKIPKI